MYVARVLHNALSKEKQHISMNPSAVNWALFSFVSYRCSYRSSHQQVPQLSRTSCNTPQQNVQPVNHTSKHIIHLPSSCLSTHTWFARNGLNRESHLGVRGDSKGLRVVMECWDHHIGHVDLLKHITENSVTNIFIQTQTRTV